ncbi:hypothetical protein [Pontibacter korlensis]|uniref:hypothetical protein n=1 Tax=Pontibacter korlensis TaxID=400092 RepID=UPI000AB70607|nr:hypothetical protein [Pontibacter korlensis]
MASEREFTRAIHGRSDRRAKEENTLAAPDDQALHKRIRELETERDILKSV